MHPGPFLRPLSVFLLGCAACPKSRPLLSSEISWRKPNSPQPSFVPAEKKSTSSSFSINLSFHTSKKTNQPTTDTFDTLAVCSARRPKSLQFFCF
ncbi:hypothetical protein BC830DRAFT_1104020 [Chytriomyces sp. MP71]|nr:hypothetical protein BC830DRAFT_1104020 [Chytriomyces sp. MP71]